MTSEEHKCTAEFIKNVHKSLREQTKIHGEDVAWAMHVGKEDILKQYSNCMQKLSECYWDGNLKQHNTIESRITWTMNYIEQYYYCEEKIIDSQREKELRVAEKIGIKISDIKECSQKTDSNRINLLDVGSCFNPFKMNEKYNVIAIDIAPADESVYKCDFLNAALSDKVNFSDSRVLNELPKAYFEVVVFSLLLEYLPTSKQRMECCLKAYNLLKQEGILVIITPDSSHKQLNAKLMKNWRYTLGFYGFSRIKIDNLKHITCMVFRKSINKDIPINWSNIHKESYMTLELNIPQDYNFDNDAAELNDQQADPKIHVRKNNLLS